MGLAEMGVNGDMGLLEIGSYYMVTGSYKG